MEDNRYPYNSYFQIITFLRTCNPARQKSFNYIEPELKGGGQDRSHDWAKIAHQTAAALKRRSQRDRMIWRWWRLTDSNTQITMKQITNKYGISDKRGYQIIDEIDDMLEEHYIELFLLAPKKKNNQ